LADLLVSTARQFVSKGGDPDLVNDEQRGPRILAHDSYGSAVCVWVSAGPDLPGESSGLVFFQSDDPDVRRSFLAKVGHPSEADDFADIPSLVIDKAFLCRTYLSHILFVIIAGRARHDLRELGLSIPLRTRRSLELKDGQLFVLLQPLEKDEEKRVNEALINWWNLTSSGEFLSFLDSDGRRVVVPRKPDL